MTVLVHVWKPHGYSFSAVKAGEERAVGHAAIEVRGPSGSAYMSWWPNEADRETLSGKVRSLWGVTASNHASVGQDTREEGGRPPVTVDVTGLDEAGILTWWRDQGKTSWSLLNTNCSQIAIDALRAGGGDDYIPGNALSRFYQTHSVVWRPLLVLDYARAVREGMARTVNTKKKP